MTNRLTLTMTNIFRPPFTSLTLIFTVVDKIPRSCKAYALKDKVNFFEQVNFFVRAEMLNEIIKSNIKQIQLKGAPTRKTKKKYCKIILFGKFCLVNSFKNINKENSFANVLRKLT